MTDDAGIYARHLQALDRYVQLGVAQGRVLSVEFPVEPNPEAVETHDLLDRIEAYLGGETDDFSDVRVALMLSSPERDILDTLRSVPYGETVTCDQLARMSPGLDPEADDAGRTVREALAANPAPVFVPTHRVRDGPNTLPREVVELLRAVESL